jgi:hypothetical protein
VDYRFGVTVSNTSNGDLSGRYYRETDYATAIHDCWYSGSPVPKMTGVTNPNPFFLYSNNYYTDNIGWGSAAITRYRAHYAGQTNPLPCSFQVFQRMVISCATEGFPSPYETVQSQVLDAQIAATTIRVSRGSVVAGPIAY